MSGVANRVAGYLNSIVVDPGGQVTLRGPTGFRLFVPSAMPGRLSPTDNNFGRYRSVFGGRVVLGPQPKRFFLTCCVFICLLLVIAVQSRDIEKQCGKTVLVFAFVLHLTSFMFFVIVCISDGGVVPRDYQLRELIWDTEDYRSRNPGSRFYRYCAKCRGFRPPRCHHCPACDICIRDQDSHLFVGGTCIGQRTMRSFLALSLTIGTLAIYLIVVNSLIIGNMSRNNMEVWRKVATFISLGTGILIILTPQLGVLLFLFRLYHIGTGNTVRTFYESFTERSVDDCPQDVGTQCLHYRRLLFGQNAPSVFRKKINSVGPEIDPDENGNEDEMWTILLTIPQGPQLLQELLNLRHEEIAQTLRFGTGEHRILNNFDDRTRAFNQTEMDLLRDLAAHARPKSIPSVPEIHNGALEKIPGQRVKKGIKSRGCDVLHRQLEDFTKNRQLSRSAVASMKQTHTETPVTLSEGSIPRTVGGTQQLVTTATLTARAQQFRQLIQHILARDREGLLNMQRRVNIRALLGVDNFDPDNLQFVELSNGLPMLAPRRRDANFNVNRFEGLLGIPQMVASGLLPPARRLALEVENELGPGSVLRVPQPITNHFVYQSQRQFINTARTDGTTLRTRSFRPEIQIDPNTLALTDGNLQGAAMPGFRNMAFGQTIWGLRPQRTLTWARRGRTVRIASTDQNQSNVSNMNGLQIPTLQLPPSRRSSLLIQASAQENEEPDANNNLDNNNSNVFMDFDRNPNQS